MKQNCLIDSYSPEKLAALAAMLAELPDDELLALVPDTKHKSPQARDLLLTELRTRVSPNQPPHESETTP